MSSADGSTAETWPAAHRDDDVCDLVTRGRRSGRAHTVEIWFGVIGDTLYFIAGNGPGSDWYRNALATPDVEVHVAGVVHRGTARDVTDAGERRRVGELMGAKYVWDGDPSIGLTFEAWCFTVPALAVENWTE